MQASKANSNVGLGIDFGKDVGTSNSVNSKSSTAAPNENGKQGHVIVTPEHMLSVPIRDNATTDITLPPNFLPSTSLPNLPIPHVPTLHTRPSMRSLNSQTVILADSFSPPASPTSPSGSVLKHRPLPPSTSSSSRPVSTFLGPGSAASSAVETCRSSPSWARIPPSPTNSISLTVQDSDDDDPQILQPQISHSYRKSSTTSPKRSKYPSFSPPASVPPSPDTLPSSPFLSPSFFQLSSGPSPLSPLPNPATTLKRSDPRLTTSPIGSRSASPISAISTTFLWAGATSSSVGVNGDFQPMARRKGKGKEKEREHARNLSLTTVMARSQSWAGYGKHRSRKRWGLGVRLSCLLAFGVMSILAFAFWGRKRDWFSIGRQEGVEAWFTQGLLGRPLKEKRDQNVIQSDFSYLTRNESGLDHPERDTLIVYRILGNDLPPRHEPGQTLRNLEFLLNEEKDWEFGPELFRERKNSVSDLTPIRRVEKYYVLNRISSSTAIQGIRGLLKKHGVSEDRIIEIKFDWEEYGKLGLNWAGGVAEEGSRIWGIGKAGSHGGGNETEMGEFLGNAKWREGMERLKALDFTYEKKNLYAINNNGGRNLALNHGRSLRHARWVLPLDGNCFFTPAAMYSLVKSLASQGEGRLKKKYVTIPMSRLTDNTNVLPNNTVQLPHLLSYSERADIDLSTVLQQVAPLTPEEPQVGFRFDSNQSYEESMRYGHRSKLEILWRLGAIPYTRGLDKRIAPWESNDRKFLTADTWRSILPDKKRHPEDMVDFIQAGWVFRLFSGSREQELHSTEANVLRNINRMKAIAGFLERLDEQLAKGRMHKDEVDEDDCGFDKNHLWSWDQIAVQTFKQKMSEPKRRFERNVLRKISSEVASTVKDLMDGPEGVSLLDMDPKDVSMKATVLALSGYLLDDTSLTTLAAEVIATRFLPPHIAPYFSQTRYLPHKRPPRNFTETLTSLSEEESGYAFLEPTWEPEHMDCWALHKPVSASNGEYRPTFAFDPLEFDPTLLLDAVRLISPPFVDLQYSKILPRPVFRNMVEAHLSYLLFNEKAVMLSRYPPDVESSLRYDCKVAALAAWTGNAILLNRIVNRARLRFDYPPDFLSDPTYFQTHKKILNGLKNVKFHPFSHIDDYEQEFGSMDMEGDWEAVPHEAQEDDETHLSDFWEGLLR